MFTAINAINYGFYHVFISIWDFFKSPLNILLSIGLIGLMVNKTELPYISFLLSNYKYILIIIFVFLYLKGIYLFFKDFEKDIKFSKIETILIVLIAFLIYSNHEVIFKLILDYKQEYLISDIKNISEGKKDSSTPKESD